MTLGTAHNNQVLAAESFTDLGGQGHVGDYLALLKPRVMSLVVFTAIVGLFAAPGTIHPWLGFVAVLCIAMGAGASGALNMWYDADIDAVMKRTATRPVPSGALQPNEALGFGLVLSITSVLMLGLIVNIASAALLAFTIFFYAVVYTMWLKRRTAQNIVIGGAAGAFPPMVAWAAVTGTIDLGSIALFLLIFMWTPPHFWALALFKEGEYEKAGIPMLPNVAGRPATKKQILIYSILLIPTIILPMLTGTVGVLYATGAVLLTAKFLADAFAVYKSTDRNSEDATTKRLFGFSILWLFALFALILVEKLGGIAPFAGIM
jgi:heme o synthase